MTLLDQANISASPSFRRRIEACAAGHGRDVAWVDANMRALAATEGWDDAWGTAAAQMPGLDAQTTSNALGARIDVISDAAIEAAVVAQIGESTQT